MKTLILTSFLLTLAGTIIAQENVKKPLKLKYAATTLKTSPSVAKNDTIKVIMLVGDTTEGTSGIVIWMAGYEIRDRNAAVVSAQSASHVRQYLDRHKLPLKSAIIVWDSKQIEQIEE
jgi:hypothetical protein